MPSIVKCRYTRWRLEQTRIDTPPYLRCVLLGHWEECQPQAVDLVVGDADYCTDLEVVLGGLLACFELAWPADQIAGWVEWALPS